MHKLIIHNLGPIDDCELEFSPFMVLVGTQAAGKSTVAKALYYFRTIKDDVESAVNENAFNRFMRSDLKDKTIIKILTETMRKKFLKTFGSSREGMASDMKLEYYYTNDNYIKIHLSDDPAYPTPNYVHIDFSKSLLDFLKNHRYAFNMYESVMKTTEPRARELKNEIMQRRKFRVELREFFNDEYDTVYIPAGRSILTLLSQNLDYVYSTMDESQNRMLDYCTQKYIEQILNIKPEFYDGLDGLMAYYGTKKKIPEAWKNAIELINILLCGTYRAENGEERLILENGKNIRINFASSGQQDALWITNLLFYYLVQKRPAMFIIEEPESHLFPSSQKYIMELISLVCNQGHSMLVTTHSPYVLGTLNNLLYASSFRKTSKQEEASKIIPSSLWLDYNKFQAWFVKGGQIDNCMDAEMKLIQNERIDEISRTINQDYDDLFNLMYGDEEETNAD